MIRFAIRSAVAAALAAPLAAACAGLDVASFDAAIDPCTSLYEHVNRRWIESTPIPDDRARWGSFDELGERNEKTLTALLDAALGKPLPPKGTPQRMAIEFYASGMDREAIAKAGLRPLEPLLENIARVRDAQGLARSIALLHARGVEAGFEFDVRPDARDSMRYLAQLRQGGLGLPDRDYYLFDDAHSQQLRDAYRRHVARLFELAGDSASAASRAADTVLALETELARYSMTAVERRDAIRTYNKRTLARLSTDAPGFPWKEFFEASAASSLADMNVAQPAFFAAFARLVSKQAPEEWRTYLRWHLLHAAAPQLPEAFAEAHFDFYERTLRGRKAPSPRSREVIEIVGGRYGTQPMGQALGMIFVEEAFSPVAKARSQAMIGNIKAVLGERLRTLEWMGEDTRRRALEKLAAMQVKIGYPDRWRDYAEADVGPYPFVENWMRAKAFIHRRDIARIGGPVDRSEWLTSPHIVNAFYNASANEIVFPAAILQPPFFDADADDAVNYGGIGVVIGHEITHGFDDRGRRYDAAGNMTDWWTQEDARRYVERAGRVSRQYAGYVAVDGIRVNGELTLGENISDVGGAKIAYLALQKSLEGKPREKIDGFTPEQRFFLSLAQVWRSSYRAEMERLQLRTDGHSPPRFRVTGIVANMPEFAQAFACDASRALLSESQRANLW